MINKNAFILFKNKKNFHIKAYGNSMYPLLRDEDIVYVQKINPDKLKLNDILFIGKKTSSYIHRLIYIGFDNKSRKKFFITKGDNTLQSDGKCFPDQIIGRVTKIKRKDEILDIDQLYLLQSSIYFQEILKIKKEFEERHIDFVFLKGLPVHQYYEGTHPKRMYSDCDILVGNESSGVVHDICLRIGYKKADTEYSRIHLLLKNKLTEISYYKHINSFPVVFDIHFEPVFMMNQIGKLDALYPQSLIDGMSQLFLSTKRYIRINSEKFPILSPECLFIYLALHFLHHNFTEIYRLNLIKIILEKDKLYLTKGLLIKLRETITRYKLNNFVYPTLLYLEKYYNLTIPYELKIDGEAKLHTFKFLYKLIHSDSIFEGESRMSEGITRFKNLYYLSPESWYKKIQIIVNISVIYTVMWVIYKKTISSARLFFLKLNQRLNH